MDSNFNIPILVIIFSRVEFSKQILQKIRSINATKLYVACDGWRNRVPGEKEKILKSREYFKKNVDWDCNVKYQYLGINYGSGEGVFKAINWFLSNEKWGIILEEDVIPSKSFFYFCKEMLEKYENDLRVWNISGQNHFLGQKNLVKEDSYFFSKYPSIWGWATWANRWRKCDFDMGKMELFISQKYRYSHTSRHEGLFALNKHKKFYSRSKNEKPSTWDAQWDFTLNTNRSIGIVPSANLTTNVGVEGVHNKRAIKHAHLLPVTEGFKVVKHPDFIQTNWKYDETYYKIFRKKNGS